MFSLFKDELINSEINFSSIIITQYISQLVVFLTFTLKNFAITAYTNVSNYQEYFKSNKKFNAHVCIIILEEIKYMSITIKIQKNTNVLYYEAGREIERRKFKIVAGLEPDKMGTHIHFHTHTLLALIPVIKCIVHTKRLQNRIRRH